MPRSLTSSAKTDRSVTIKDDSDPTITKQHESDTIGPKGYILSRYSLLKSINEKGGIGQVWRRWPGQKNAAFLDDKNIKFRSDIDDFVLTLMRRRVVDELVWLDGRREARVSYFSHCHGEDLKQELKKKKQVGAVLWLGKDNGAKEVDNVDRSGRYVNPGVFATIDLEKSKLPVHDLRKLLGEENITLLRQKAPKTFDAVTAVTLKQKLATVRIQMRLWKLQGYMASHAEQSGTK